MSDKQTIGTGGNGNPWGRTAVLITCLVGILLAVSAFVLSWRSETAEIKTVLDFRADWRTKDMEGKLARLGTFLAGMTAYMATVPDFTQKDFEKFVSVRQAYSNLPDHSAVYWEYVPQDKRDAYENRMRRETGDPNFVITERVPGTSNIGPAQKRDFYFAMTRRVTRTKNPLFPFGYDVWSDPTRHAAIKSAWRNGKIVSALPFSTPSWPVNDLALQLVSPLYKDGLLPATEDERLQSLTGMVSVTYSLQDLLAYIIADTPPITEDIYLFMKPPDPTQTEDSIAVFKRKEQRFIAEPNAIRLADMRGMVFRKSMDFRGVQWNLAFHFCEEEVDALRTFEPWLFLIMGLFVTAVATYYVEIMRRKREQMRLALAAGETQLRATTSELTVTNVRLAALVNSSPAAIICLDTGGKVTLWNPAAEKMLGYTAAEMMGKPYAITAHETYKPHESGQKNHVTREATQTTKDGRKVHVTFTSAPFNDESGKAIGLIYVMSDITEKLSLERQLRQAQKMEAVGQLTGGVAHDFNNLLGILIGNLDLMEGTTNDYGEKLRALSVDAVMRGASLTRSLLAFSRQQSLSPAVVNINQHLSSTVDLLSRSLGEQVEIKLKTEPALWPAYVDPVQLESAITNLAINARDAMPQNGKLLICTCNRTLDEDYIRHNPEAVAGDYACIEVTDTGSGMPPDVLARVFEPFFSTKATGKGTGLGLSMVYGFIKQSNGHIKIYSEPDHGTTIRLYLPRYKNGGSRHETETKPKIIKGGGETIFVVEDNPAMRTTAVSQLESLGYRTIEAASGQDAWEMIQNGATFDLLFSDVVMPGKLSGFDLAKRACAFNPKTRILLTSGFPGLLSAEQREAEAGCGIELLSKPYRKTDLANKIREMLDKPV